MTEAGFYQPRSASPTTLAVVVALHGAALTALALAKMDVIHIPKAPTTIVDFIDETKPPPPVPPEPMVQQHQKSVIDQVIPIVTPAKTGDEQVDRSEIKTATADLTPGPTIEPVRPPPITLTPPVRKEAQIDPRSELKPPYPASEQRSGTEGIVTVRVLIGADGRVKSAEKVRATNDAFFLAAQRHALRSWRFKPATVDGRPVESSKLMTLHFELDG